jgi:hypothetical protein
LIFLCRSGISFSIDSANNTDDERITGQILASRKVRESIVEHMNKLQSGDDDLALKLSKLRQSFLDSGVMVQSTYVIVSIDHLLELQTVPRSRTSKWTLVNLKIIFIVEAIVLLSVILV